jgi:hypothetical protein
MAVGALTAFCNISAPTHITIITGEMLLNLIKPRSERD